MDKVLSEITKIMSDKYKYKVFDYDQSFVIDMIKKRMSDLNFTRFSEYKYYLNSNKNEAYLLNESLLVQFSEFFRDGITFSVIEQFILPKMMVEKKQGDSIRIWSTSCSSGEEIYSLAMLIKERFEINEKELTVNLFGTDIDEAVVERAILGIYEEAKMERVPLKYLNRYFVKKDDMYHIKPEIKDMVTFSEHNLLDMNTTTPAISVYGHFDIILCNNVLYYYNQANQVNIMRKLEKALNPDGYIFTDGVSLKAVKEQLQIKSYHPEMPIFQIKEG